ncbi:acyl carrier protein [uncultured Dialister sp.]|jgi:D-alanine--poly(phosphoribitol) ligase subunit 2|uniref:acyl carrier protein n=1 Tax=uncultured Dialister sp. TaxID=278064 RepID=UPI00265E42C2|nr:acyl carrier protein [uncultured Dialister sp.]
MEKKQISAIISKIIVNINSSFERYNEDSDLFAEGILDSFSLMQLVMHLDESFRIEIDADDIVPENFSTLRNISSLVKRYTH